MKPKIRELVKNALGMFVKTTGIKVVHQTNMPKKEKDYPDGWVRIDHRNMHWKLAVEAKTWVTQATAAMTKTQAKTLQQDYILITEHITPPMADLLKTMGLFFMDTAGNAYVNKPPIFVFIKGNKTPEKAKPVPVQRLFKPAGLKVVFALLNCPEMVNWPYRQIAEQTGVALGTVDWIFKDLKEMGFLIELDKRKRKMTNRLNLLKRWVEVYPDQLRPKLVIERFNTDQFHWWEDVDITDYNACWAGEVAAAKLTRLLKPEKIIIFANEIPGKLIIQKKLRKATTGDIEFLEPFWRFDNDFIDLGIAPPLIVYADLMVTGDERNINTAGIIYDKYLIQPDQ